MLDVNIEKILPITAVRDGLNKIIDEVEGGDELYVVTKNGKPAAIIVGVHHLEKLTGIDHKMILPDEEDKAETEEKKEAMTPPVTSDTKIEEKVDTEKPTTPTEEISVPINLPPLASSEPVKAEEVKPETPPETPVTETIVAPSVADTNTDNFDDLFDEEATPTVTPEPAITPAPVVPAPENVAEVTPPAIPVATPVEAPPIKLPTEEQVAPAIVAPPISSQIIPTNTPPAQTSMPSQPIQPPVQQ